MTTPSKHFTAIINIIQVTDNAFDQYGKLTVPGKEVKLAKLVLSVSDFVMLREQLKEHINLIKPLD